MKILLYIALLLLPSSGGTEIDARERKRDLQSFGDWDGDRASSSMCQEISRQHQLCLQQQGTNDGGGGGGGAWNGGSSSSGRPDRPSRPTSESSWNGGSSSSGRPDRPSRPTSESSESSWSSSSSWTSSCEPCITSGDPCAGSVGCDEGGDNGDPHMTTFDGLRYSCQARGEFVLFKASSGFQIQTRFEKIGQRVSLTTAIAISGGPGTTTLQVEIPDTKANSGSMPGVKLYVNGVEAPGEYEDEDVLAVADESSTSFYIYYKSSQISIYPELRLPFSHPHLNVRLTLPPGFRNEQDGGGLLGLAPDNDVENDWLTPSGRTLPIPTSFNELMGKAGYEYCTVNWCIRDERESIFQYNKSGGRDFDFYSGCDDPFPGTINLRSVTSELSSLCGQDLACRIDGFELGVDGAQSLLVSEATVSAASSMQANFGANPAVITANGRSVGIELTVDLSKTASRNARKIDSFAVYRVDPETRKVVGRAPIASLKRDRSSNRKDIIFSNSIRLRSNSAGEAFGFKAIPVIDGSEKPKSKLAFTSLYAVRSYSIRSGITAAAVGGGGDDKDEDNNNNKSKKNKKKKKGKNSKNNKMKNKNNKKKRGNSKNKCHGVNENCNSGKCCKGLQCRPVGKNKFGKMVNRCSRRRK